MKRTERKVIIKMTNKEIFYKAFFKAYDSPLNCFQPSDLVSGEINLTSMDVDECGNISLCGSRCFHVYEFIFRHDFVRAFWGEELIWTTADEEYTDYAWIVHLQEMVICEEPLKYLEKFLK